MKPRRKHEARVRLPRRDANLDMLSELEKALREWPNALVRFRAWDLSGRTEAETVEAIRADVIARRAKLIRVRCDADFQDGHTLIIQVGSDSYWQFAIIRGHDEAVVLGRAAIIQARLEDSAADDRHRIRKIRVARLRCLINHRWTRLIGGALLMTVVTGAWRLMA